MFEHFPVSSCWGRCGVFCDFFLCVHFTMDCYMTSWYNEYSLHLGNPGLIYLRFPSRCPSLFEVGIQTPSVWDKLCDLRTCQARGTHLAIPNTDPQRIQYNGFLTMLLDTALIDLVLFWQRDMVESPFDGVVVSVSCSSSLDMECTFQCMYWSFGTCLERSTSVELNHWSCQDPCGLADRDTVWLQYSPFPEGCIGGASGFPIQA